MTYNLTLKVYFVRIFPYNKNIFCFCLNCSETGVSGKILVNGKNRSTNSQTFRNLSAYIHQEDALRPYLTVGEAMNVATNLKLGYNVTKEYKSDLVSILYDIQIQYLLVYNVNVYVFR